MCDERDNRVSATLARAPAPRRGPPAGGAGPSGRCVRAAPAVACGVSISASHWHTGRLESTPRPRPLAPCRGGECYATYVNVWGRACACHAVMGPGVRAPAAAHAAGRGPGRDLRPTTRNREKRLSHEPARRRRRRGGVIGTRVVIIDTRVAPRHRTVQHTCFVRPLSILVARSTLSAIDRVTLSKYPLRLSPRRYIENRIYRSGDRARTIQYVVLLVSLFHLLFYADFSLDCSRDLAASYALS